MRDPTGEQYGKLTVLSLTERRYKNGDRFVQVRCECGVEKEMRYPAAKRATSCGCQRWQDAHRMTGTPLYRAWLSMHQRCYNPNDSAYANYGGRGIQVARRWHRFEQFQVDMAEGFRPGLVLDRMHNDQGYRRSNCRWLTRAESNRNMRSNLVFLVEGRTLCFAELVREYGQVPYRKALYRYQHGWKIQRALGATAELTIKDLTNEKTPGV